MDLTVSLAGQMLTTPVYIKMDTLEPLLLSEGVCRQLGILQYHPDVQLCSSKEGQRAVSAAMTEGTERLTEGQEELPDTSLGDAIVPTISVRLIQSLRLPPGHCAVVLVAMDGVPPETTKLVEPDVSLREELGLEFSAGLLRMRED